MLSCYVAVQERLTNRTATLTLATNPNPNPYLVAVRYGSLAAVRVTLTRVLCN